MAKLHAATDTNAEDYWQLFVNRRAYVLQAMRPHPRAAAITTSDPKPARMARHTV